MTDNLNKNQFYFYISIFTSFNKSKARKAEIMKWAQSILPELSKPEVLRKKKIKKESNNMTNLNEKRRRYEYSILLRL